MPDFLHPLRTALALLVAIAGLAIPAPAHARPFRHLTHQPGFIDYWPRFSPDGKTVLFSRCEISTGCRDDAFGHVTLWTVPAAGGKARKFLDLDGVSATRSDWLWNTSVTSQQIAFTGIEVNENPKLGLWFVNADGSNPFKLPLPDSVGLPSYPSWFPDGASVAVTGRVAGEPGPHLTRVEVASGDPIETLTLPAVIWTGQPAVSRDGTMVAAAAQLPIAGQEYNDNNNQIWIEKVGDANTEDLGLHQLDALQSRTPDWSPNDRFLIFESTRGCVNGNHAIFMEAASGGKAVQATDCALDANHGVWSPDGRRFAFAYRFGSPDQGKCAGGGCRGIAIAPVPAKVRRLGAAN